MEKQFKILDPYDNELFTVLWKPKGRKKPLGIVQLIHGAGEHVMRYKEFAEYLNELGFIVVGNDHLGHGRTTTDEDYVHFADDIGFHKVYGGVQIVRDWIEENYPKLPVIMFAHSMGSFIGRYAILYDHKRYDLACFSGTGWFNPISLRAGILGANALIKAKGKRHVSEAFTDFATEGAIKSMMKNGLINKRIEWLTHDRDIQKAFLEDPLCGKPFTIGAHRDVFQFIKEIQDKKRIRLSASSTAIYFISGELDGLGDYGIAAKKLHKYYLDCGYSNVKYSVINGMRHEIINEIERDKVYQMIGDWMLLNVK
jgi:alpha-beta hydrolase superfamily lysophospholipase